MKENIVIPITIEWIKLWTRRTLETAGWLVCLGLFAASAAVAAFGMLAWLVIGSDSVIVVGLGGGLMLGLAGVWQLLRRIDRAANLLRGNAAVEAGAGRSAVPQSQGA